MAAFNSRMYGQACTCETTPRESPAFRRRGIHAEVSPQFSRLAAVKWNTKMPWIGAGNVLYSPFARVGWR